MRTVLCSVRGDLFMLQKFIASLFSLSLIVIPVGKAPAAQSALSTCLASVT